MLERQAQESIVQLLADPDSESKIVVCHNFVQENDKFFQQSEKGER